MANRTAWTGGNLNAGLGWTSLFSSTDLNGLGPNYSVRSVLADITNGTGLDQFMDVSVRCQIAQSTTVTLGISMALFLYPLLDDGSTYGDNFLPTAGFGGRVTGFPSLQPAAVFGVPLPANFTSMTGIAGFAQGILMPPGSFRPVFYQNVGFTFTGTQNVLFRSYNINLNN